MKDTLRIFKFFTVADFEKEAQWLQEMHGKGYALERIKWGCFYYFKEVEPEEIVYQLEYQAKPITEDKKRMYEDYGWHYVDDAVGWLYFRKEKRNIHKASEGEIFSDDASLLEMIDRFYVPRLLTLLCIFTLLILPRVIDTLTGLLSGQGFGHGFLRLA